MQPFRDLLIGPSGVDGFPKRLITHSAQGGAVVTGGPDQIVRYDSPLDRVGDRKYLVMGQHATIVVVARPAGNGPDMIEFGW